MRPGLLVFGLMLIVVVVVVCVVVVCAWERHGDPAIAGQSQAIKSSLDIILNFGEVPAVGAAGGLEFQFLTNSSRLENRVSVSVLASTNSKPRA